jgi:hypothetical protein
MMMMIGRRRWRIIMIIIPNRTENETHYIGKHMKTHSMPGCH